MEGRGREVYWVCECRSFVLTLNVLRMKAVMASPPFFCPAWSPPISSASTSASSLRARLRDIEGDVTVNNAGRKEGNDRDWLER